MEKGCQAEVVEFGRLRIWIVGLGIWIADELRSGVEGTREV